MCLAQNQDLQDDSQLTEWGSKRVCHEVHECRLLKASVLPTPNLRAAGVGLFVPHI
jgi:hypothetical protein